MSKAIPKPLDNLFSFLRRRLSPWRAGQAELEARQSLFFQSINALQEGYVVQDKDGVVLLCNAGAERLLGVSSERLTGQSVERLGWHFLRENGDEFPQAQHPSRLALQTGQPQETVVAGIQRPGADVVWLSMESAPVFHAGQAAPYAAVLTFCDITAKKQAEEELQAEREFQQALMESLQSGIVACNADGILTLFNRAAREFHGLPEQPVPPEMWANHFDLYQSDGMTPLSTQDIPLFRALQGESVREAEMVIAPKDSLSRTLLASGQAIYSRQGRKLGAVVAMHDVTARRQTEREMSRLAAIVESSEEAILAATLDGILVSWNVGAERLYGYAASEMIGQHASVLVPAGEASPVTAIIPRLRRGELIAPIEVVRRRPDGVLLNVSLAFSPIHDPAGEMIGLSCVARDITARRQVEAALQESHNALQKSEARLAEAQRIAQIGSWEYDLVENKITWSNELFRLFGLDPADGEPDYAAAVALYDAEDAARLDALVARAVQEGISYALDLRGAPSLFPDSSPKWYHTAGSAVTDSSGRVVRLVGTLVDITERRQTEEALRRSEEALRALMSSAPVILYAADTAGTITLSEGTGLAALGLAPGEAVGRSIFEFTGGDPSQEKNLRRALAGETVTYDARYGALCLHVELRPQHDANGNVTGIIGVCFDITERAQSEERFRVLFEQSSDAHLLFDDSGIIDCNPAAFILLGCADKTHLLSLHPAEFSPEFQPDGQRSDLKSRAMDAAAREKGVHRFEWVHRRRSGEDFPVEVTLTPVTLQGRPMMLVVWHDLTERKKVEQEIRDYAVILEFQKNQLKAVNKELETLATTDGLTGLRNHRTFQDKLAEEHSRAMRYHQPLSLLLLDVDHFKQYNDSFGHPAGDAVLKAVAATLGHAARDTDMAARYGGEEFALILPQTDAAGAMVIAERVRAAVAGSDWEQRPITVSLGACTLSLDTPTPSALVACADKALYHAKETGRNRVSDGGSAGSLRDARLPRTTRPKSPRPVPPPAENCAVDSK